MAKEESDSLLVVDTLRIFYRAMAVDKVKLALSFLHPIGAILMSVAVPFFAGRILAGITQQNANLTPDLVLLALCSAGGILANRIGFLKLMALQARAMAELHETIFERLLRRSVGYHTNNISGKLVSDAVDFINGFGSFGNAGFLTSLSFAASIVAGLIIVFLNSWQLGIFLLIVVVVTLIWAGVESRRRSALRNKRLVASKKLISHLSDNIVNAQTVKTFAQEDTEIKRNHELNSVLARLRVRDWSRAGRSGSNRAAALLLMQFCMIVYIIYLTRGNPAMLATGIFAFTYTLTLSNRLFEINNLTRQVEECFLQASPMTQMLKESVEIQDSKNAKQLRVTKGRIEVENVFFTYPEQVNGAVVFEGFSLSVKPGEKIGLVGPSGGGKSTLTRLLLRFDDVQDGSITIDNQNIAAVTQKSLRSAVAYVPQEPLLFHRSIRENIAYGKPKASQKAILKAAKKANAHDFISALPAGYDTVVGERGVKLSGGQRQRVAIARAILKDAPILVLDEATSALDSENEIQVQKALWKLMEGRTAIVIAHRLSTIQRMDRIVVVDDGKIIEQGSHKQLLAEKGLYAKLWAHQSGGFIDGPTYVD
jgi:ATP-binding cassette subfamily B protein